MNTPKKSWTPKEDQALLEAIDKWGMKSWIRLSSVVAGRTAKQCRDRWCNHLNPMVNKGDWTIEEDRILLKAQRKFGNCWTRIAREFLPGRTDLAVKNRYYSRLRRIRRKAKQNIYDMVEEKLMTQLLTTQNLSKGNLLRTDVLTAQPTQTPYPIQQPLQPISNLDPPTVPAPPNLAFVCPLPSLAQCYLGNPMFPQQNLLIPQSNGTNLQNPLYMDPNMLANNNSLLSLLSLVATNQHLQKM